MKLVALLLALAILLPASSLTLPAQTPDPATAEPPELATARARYEQEVKTATTPVKGRYAQTLEALKKSFGARGELTSALAIQHEIERLGLAQKPFFSTTKEAKVVLWNQHNGGYNDRGVNVVNVVLLTEGRETWRQNGVKVPWEAGKDTKAELAVPYQPTDKLRVELVDCVNKQGRLAEIEYWWEGRNVARKRPVVVSGVWENDKRFAGAMLTDGITTSKEHAVGYWNTPNGEAGAGRKFR